jgi:hypothetical protein
MKKTIYTKFFVDQISVYQDNMLANIFLLKDWMGLGHRTPGTWNAWQCQILSHRGHTCPIPYGWPVKTHVDQRAGSVPGLPVQSLQNICFMERSRSNGPRKDPCQIDGKK